MRIRISLFILFVICTTVLAGCWDYREVNRLSIVAGMAIDKSETGEYKITTEIVDMHEGGKDVKIKSKLIESSGDTLFDAIRNAIKYNQARLYFGHADIIILSQEVARDGVIDIIDFMSRDPEPRLSIDILVSKEKTAKEIFEAESVTTEIRSYGINDMLDAQVNLSKSPKVEIYQFINDLPCDGISPVLPGIRITENAGVKTMELSGAAVFKEDKLIGFIEEEDIKYYNFITNKIKGGLLALNNSPDANNADITLEISENKTKIKSSYSNGNISINIETNTQVSLGEQGTSEKLFSEKGRLLLKKDAEEMLKANILRVIQKIQRDFDADIFGFGRTIKNDMPALWKDIENDWMCIFKEQLEVYINSTIEIRDSGLLYDSIKVGS